MTKSKSPRLFLVVIDDSEELHQALHFACVRARATEARIALVYIIAPAEFAHWAGVGELMREEAREEAEEKMRVHSEYVQQLTGQPAQLFIREGDVADQVIQLIDEQTDIRLLVLGADTNSDSAGPIVNYMTGRGASRCRVPITIVPGNLTDAQIDQLT